MGIRSEVGKDEAFEHKFAKIVQAKVVRYSERAGRSRRFGFVEFREHGDALLVLRALNNKSNDELFGERRSKSQGKVQTGNVQIEFAVQNMKKLNIHWQKTAAHRKKWRSAN